MENFAPQPHPDGGPSGDIWDRVHTLAPTCRPAGVAVFRTTPNYRAAHHKSAAKPIAPVSGVVIEDEPFVPATKRRLAWEQLMVAAPDMARRNAPSGLEIALDRDTPAAQAFDQLRTRLLQTMKANNWSKVAITSPSPKCGSTFTACNLAVSLSRIASCRTVLVDLNLRAPGVARAFGLHPHMDFRRFLTGDVPASSGLVRYSDNLALGLAAKSQAATAELLCDPRTVATLNQVQSSLQPDLVLYDLPPMLAYDDVPAFLPQVDGVLLVADGTQTIARQIADCEKMIAGQTKLLGVVLNRGRDRLSDTLRYENG